MKKQRVLDPNLIHIGLVRYADHYHPTNEQSVARLHDLADKLHCEFPNDEIPRSLKLTMMSIALTHGYQLHFFEKGLGR